MSSNRIISVPAIIKAFFFDMFTVFTALLPPEKVWIPLIHGLLLMSHSYFRKTPGTTALCVRSTDSVLLSTSADTQEKRNKSGSREIWADVLGVPIMSESDSIHHRHHYLQSM